MATNKLLWSSKLIGVFFIMLVCTLSANAQFLRTSYFMEGTHYRQQLNPALTPTKGYFNLPVIGAVNATVGSTSLGYQDIIDIIDDGDDFYTKPDFMNRLHEEFPYYDWDHNKGYPTKKHRAAIAERGTTPYHRMTFNLLGDGQLTLSF